MKILRIDSIGGASGDMLLGALTALGADLQYLNEELKKILPDDDFEIKSKDFADGGMNGVQLSVEIPHHHHHEHRHHETHSHTAGHHHHHHAKQRNYGEIRKLLEDSPLRDERARELSLKAFRILAEAEAEVHGADIDNVHFHEVGAVDSIVDITGCCLAYSMLGIDRISFGSIPVGRGSFECQHGTYPLPPPATLKVAEKHQLLLEQSSEPFEMLTPTGAALLATFERDTDNCSGSIIKSVNSFGHRKLKDRVNMLRASLIETQDQTNGSGNCIKLECNLDDVSGEVIGATCEQLLAKGALDVWTCAIQMKKQRPGILLSVLCDEQQQKILENILFRETGTLGIRVERIKRHILPRSVSKIKVNGIEIRIKNAELDGKNIVQKIEFADCRKLAEAENISVRQAMELISRQLQKSKEK